MRILAVVVYVGVIFALSSWRNPPAGPELPFLDKLVHVIEYGGLGALLAWAAGSYRVRGLRRLGLVVMIGLAVAVADELYQRFTPGRESSAYDALADLAGLVLAGAVASIHGQARESRMTRA